MHKKPTAPRKKSKWWKWLLGLFILAFVGLFAYGAYFLPSVENASQLQFSESTVIYDRGALDPEENPNDHVLYVIHGDENREYLPLTEIPEWMKKATIAIEDDQFYDHFGFDVGGLTKAVLNRFFGIGTSRGGSTITQQLVKNSFLSREKTITRKFKELLLSMKVEWYYTKDEILEMYLNKIPYGHNAHGVEAAAKTFFGKSARELTLAESAILACLPVAPTRFSPYGANKKLLTGFYEENSETGERVYKKGRKDLVLKRMLDLEMITFEQFKTAWAESKEVEFRKYKTDIKAPHFVFYVREKMEEKYGKEFLRYGGLRIYTTLNPDLQNIAEETISEKTEHYLDTHEAKNAALAAINPESGELLAFVGGKDYFDTENDGQVNILTARRQPGSSFKPFVYAASFEKGYSPATAVFDVETDFGGNYQPQNFDGNFIGPVSARIALNHSLNIPAVKMAFLATPQSILDLAEKVGIKFEGDADRHGVALGVGVAEVEPLSHISAFQVFVNNGSYFDPTAILEVQDANGKVLEKFDASKTKKEAIQPEVAALVRNILTDETTRPVTEEFEWNKLLQLGKFDNGSKTGTSNRKVENPDFNEEEEEDEEENPKTITVPGDSWTIGFTPHLVTGVWVGNNRGEPMKPGATGLAVAAPIWKRFMLDAHKNLVEKGADPKKPYVEIELETRKVNKFSGHLATELTPLSVVQEEVFAPFAVPSKLDESIKTEEIDSFTGQPPTRFTPRFARIEQTVLDLKSIRSDLPHWREPVEEWITTHPEFMSSLGEIMDEEEDEDEEGNETEKEELKNENRLSFSPFYRRRRTLLDKIPNALKQRNIPLIKIISPKDGGTLSPGEIEINVSVSAKSEMKGVEFYFDDILITDSEHYPWKGRFALPSQAKIGTTHTLRAVAIDWLYNMGEHEIEVIIGGDYEGPEINFLGPKGNQHVPVNSMVHILADIKDYESRVKKAEFWVDEKNLGEVLLEPFQQTFVAKGNLGRHHIMARAWDEHGNFSEKTIPILYDREKLLKGSTPEISKITNYRNTISIDMIFPNPKNIEWAELLVIQGQTVPFQKKFEVNGKSAQFHVPKNRMGKARVKLTTKFFGKEEPVESPEKITNL